MVTQDCQARPRGASAASTWSGSRLRSAWSRRPAWAAYWNERTMPATSTSAPRLMRRSVGDRDGSPSKSMITKSRPACSTWPRW